MMILSRVMRRKMMIKSNAQVQVERLAQAGQDLERSFRLKTYLQAFPALFQCPLSWSKN
jgi:hypothetical protein